MKKLEARFAYKKNPVASALKVIGIIVYVIGLICGIVFGLGFGYYNGFAWLLAVLWWVGGFIIGTFIIGFAEIIKLLNDIKFKNYAEVNEEFKFRIDNSV